MPISSEDAGEILQHLLSEMNRSGYGEFTRDAFLQTQRDPQLSEYTVVTNQRFLLRFIDNFVMVLRLHSNDDFQKILRKFNEHSTGEKMESILVDSFDSPENQSFDLVNLPSYTKLIEEIKEIRETIIQNLEGEI